MHPATQGPCWPRTAFRGKHKTQAVDTPHASGRTKRSKHNMSHVMRVQEHLAMMQLSFLTRTLTKSRIQGFSGITTSFVKVQCRVNGSLCRRYSTAMSSSNKGLASKAAMTGILKSSGRRAHSRASNLSDSWLKRGGGGGGGVRPVQEKSLQSLRHHQR